MLSLPNTLALLLALPPSTALQEASSLPQAATAEAAAPRASEPVLAVSWAGLERALVAPADAGLLRALRLADDRLVALASTPSWDGPPPPMMRLVFDLLASPLELVVSVPEEAAPGGAPPVALRLEVGGTPGEVAALAERLPSLLGMPSGQGGDPDPEHPGLRRLETPAGTLRHGVPTDGDGRLVVLLGTPPQVPAPAGATRGERALALRFDGRGLAPLIELARQQGDPDVDEMVQIFELFGLLGEDPLRGWMEIAHDEGGLARLSSRTHGLSSMLARLGSPQPEPLDPEVLRLVPRDATYAQVGRQEPMLTLNMIDRLGSLQPGGADWREEFRSATGLDVEADLVAPLGDVQGLYLAQETGGGFLGAAMFLSLDEPERLLASLSSLAERASELLASEADGRVRVERWEPDGLSGATGWRVVFPELPVPVQPTLLVVDGWMFVGPFSDTVRVAALQARAGASSLADSPAFQQALARVGLERPVSIQWSDTPAQLEGNYGFVRLLGTALDNLLLQPGVPSGPVASVVPTAEVLVRGARPTLVLGAFEGDAFVSEGVMDGSVLANAGGIAGSYFGLMMTVGLTSATVAPRIAMAQAASEQADWMRQQELAQPLIAALEAYAADHDGVYPPDLNALHHPEGREPYLAHDQIPIDDWGRPLVYVAPTEDAPWPTILSYGADGTEGGFGADEDVYYY